jgi:hypothetical protein
MNDTYNIYLDDDKIAIRDVARMANITIAEVCDGMGIIYTERLCMTRRDIAKVGEKHGFKVVDRWLERAKFDVRVLQDKIKFIEDQTK